MYKLPKETQEKVELNNNHKIAGKKYVRHLPLQQEPSRHGFAHESYLSFKE